MFNLFFFFHSGHPLCNNGRLPRRHHRRRAACASDGQLRPAGGRQLRARAARHAQADGDVLDGPQRHLADAQHQPRQHTGGLQPAYIAQGQCLRSLRYAVRTHYCHLKIDYSTFCHF